MPTMASTVAWFRRLRSYYDRFWQEHRGWRDLRDRRDRAWDYAQANDWEVRNRDPNINLTDAAVARLTSEPQAALGALRDLAEGGSTWAMLWLALSYQKGECVPSDAAVAEDWYRRAFEAGCDRGLLGYMGCLWHRGDLEGCERVLGTAVARNWPPACYWMACALMRRSKSHKTLARVRMLLEQAVEQGSPIALRALGRLMTLGRFGLRKIPHGFRLLWRYVSQTRIEDVEGEIASLRARQRESRSVVPPEDSEDTLVDTVPTTH